MEYGKLQTELRNPRTMHIDRLDTLEMLRCIHEEDRRAVEAVGAVLPQIAPVIDRIAAGMAQGGRLIYTGCGTSGRLGVLDASECPPTYGVEPGLVIGVIAGGDRALRSAIEGAEDSRPAGRAALGPLALQPQDVVVGLSAAGGAAFVLGWDEVFSNVLGEMGLWSAHGTSSLLPQADWPQILKEFYCMSPQLFAICSTAGYAMISNVVCLVSFAAVLAIWIAVLVCSMRGGVQDGRRRKVLIQSLLMALPLAVVLGYFVVMHDHAIVHIPVFGCKNWSIVFAILFVSGVSALRGLRSQKVA